MCKIFIAEELGEQSDTVFIFDVGCDVGSVLLSVNAEEFFYP